MRPRHGDGPRPDVLHHVRRTRRRRRRGMLVEGLVRPTRNRGLFRFALHERPLASDACECAQASEVRYIEPPCCARLDSTMGYLRSRLMTNLAGLDRRNTLATEASSADSAAEAQKRRICLIRQSFFPSDPRPRKEVLALLEEGHDVDIICLQGEGQPLREVWKRARVFRAPVRHCRTGVRRYTFQYALFFSAAFVYVTVLDAKRRYDAVQVNTLPDALAFSAVVPWLRGARIVVDFQELMPEMFSAEFPGRERLTNLLRVVERLAASFADHAIIANPAQAHTFRARNDVHGRWTLVPNVPEEGVFAPLPAPRRRSRHSTLMTHGTLVERYGAHVLISALPSLLERHDVSLDIVGMGEQLPELIALARELEVMERVSFSQRWLTPQELAERIRAADIGVVPILSHGYLETVTPNKLFDYVASGLPVVASDTAGLRAWFNDPEVQFFEPGNPEALSEAVATVLADQSRAETLASNAMKTYQALRWSRQKRNYQAIFRDGKRRSDVRRHLTAASMGHQTGIVGTGTNRR
jgi:glycosyltransferase involved in cell wall biosynthesis